MRQEPQNLIYAMEALAYISRAVNKEWLTVSSHGGRI